MWCREQTDTLAPFLPPFAFLKYWVFLERKLKKKKKAIHPPCQVNSRQIFGFLNRENDGSMIFQVLKLQFMVRCQLARIFLCNIQYFLLLILGKLLHVFDSTEIKKFLQCPLEQEWDKYSRHPDSYARSTPSSAAHLHIVFIQLGRAIAGFRRTEQDVHHLQTSSENVQYHNEVVPADRREHAFWEDFTCRNNCFELKLLNICKLFGLAWHQHLTLPTFPFPSGKFITYMKISTWACFWYSGKKNKQWIYGIQVSLVSRDQGIK